MRSHSGRTSEVLKRREAAKRRHESGVEAKTQTVPIGKGSNGLSASTASAIRKVTEKMSSARVRVISDTASGKSPAGVRK